MYKWIILIIFTYLDFSMSAYYDGILGPLFVNKTNNQKKKKKNTELEEGVIVQEKNLEILWD